MKIDLTGRVALVTGGSKGIGLAIAQALAECDANVSVIARSPADLSSALETLPATTPAPLAVCADVAVSEEVERAVSETADHFGGLDIVVCNCLARDLTLRPPTALSGRGSSALHWRSIQQPYS